VTVKTGTSDTASADKPQKDAVLHVVEGRDAQRNHPGHGDTQRLAKIIRRVDDIAVRVKRAPGY
jgi:hypothetical protein